MDAFALLSLPRDLSFDEAQLREAYRSTSKSTPDEVAQAALTSAYQLLRSPSARLRHWLELAGREGSVRGTIDGELLDWFGGVGPPCRRRMNFAAARTMPDRPGEGADGA